VNLQSDCPRLGLGPAGLVFRPNRTNAAIDATRICGEGGEGGETVHSANQPQCAIHSVQIIDKAKFDRCLPTPGAAAVAPTNPRASPEQAVAGHRIGTKKARREAGLFDVARDVDQSSSSSSPT